MENKKVQKSITSGEIVSSVQVSDYDEEAAETVKPLQPTN